MSKTQAPTGARVPKVGDTVHVVLSATQGGSHKPARVTRVHRADLVDVEFEFDGKIDFKITSSPFDSTGKVADSWHWPEE